MCDQSFIIDNSPETKEVLRTMSIRRKIERLTTKDNILGYRYFKKLRTQQLKDKYQNEFENFYDFDFAEAWEIANMNAWRDFGHKGRKQFKYLAEQKFYPIKMIQHQKRNFKLYGRYIEYWTIGENDKYQVWPDAKKEDTGISKMPAIPEEMEHELDDLVKDKFSELDVKTNDKIFEEQEKILPKDDEIKKIEDVETSKMLAISEEMEHEMDNEIVTEELSELDVKKHVQIFYESDEILRKKDTQTSKMPAISANQESNNNDQFFEGQDDILRKEDEIKKIEDQLRKLKGESEYSGKKDVKEKIFKRFYKLSPALLENLCN